MKYPMHVPKRDEEKTMYDRLGDEPEVFEAQDPADLEDELRDRSEHVSDQRDAAYECGQDDYYPDSDREVGALKWDSPRLQQDYRDGWDNAAIADRPNIAPSGGADADSID